MNNIFFLLSSTVEQTSQNLDYNALATQVMLETPLWQLILIGLIASILFIAVFMGIFIAISYIISFILTIIDKYYEKTGKKRPIRKYKKKSGRHF